MMITNSQSIIYKVSIFVVLTHSIYGFDERFHLGTKTPYHFQYNETTIHENCELRHINLISRHGSRQPTNSDALQLEDLEQILRINSKYITNPKFGWMKNWENPYANEIAGDLVEIGAEELYNISKRLTERFKPLFSNTYYPVRYVIQTTQTSRTSRSGAAFGFGAWEGKGQLGLSNFEPLYIYTESPSLDYTLRFFDNCPIYQRELTEGKMKIQSKTFLKSKMQSMKTSVMEILGVNASNWSLTEIDLDSLYTACAFDIAVKGDTTKFCSLFNEDQFLTWEYYDDLESYYEKGYGSPISYKISAPLLQEFFRITDQVISGILPYQKAKFRFAHAETLLPFLALLGLYNDSVPLKWDSPSEVIHNRLWKSSDLSPFAANLAFLLYNCSGQYSIRLLHNERDIPFPFCKDTVLCPYEKVKTYYESYLDYNLNSLCNDPPEPIHTTSNQGLPITSVVGIAIGTFFCGLLVTFVIFFLINRRYPQYERFNKL